MWGGSFNEYLNVKQIQTKFFFFYAKKSRQEENFRSQILLYIAVF